jgi:hypothetical protein
VKGLHKIHEHKNSSNPLLLTIKTQMMNKARNQEHKIHPKVRPHHKGVLLPVVEPTKGHVFSHLNPPQADHKGQDKSLSQLAQRVGDTNFLGSSTNLETPKQPQPSTNTRFKSNKSARFDVCNKLKMRGKEEENENQVIESKNSNLTPSDLSINRRGSDLGCEWES